MRRISWTEALTCPAVAGLVKDARSVARNQRHSWYPAWLPNSAIFNAALRALAAWLDVGNLDDVRDVVLTGLLDEYHTERRNVPHVPPVHRPAPVEDPAEFERPWRLAEHGWRAERRRKRQL